MNQEEFCFTLRKRWNCTKALGAGVEAYISTLQYKDMIPQQLLTREHYQFYSMGPNVAAGHWTQVFVVLFPPVPPRCLNHCATFPDVSNDALG